MVAHVSESFWGWQGSCHHLASNVVFPVANLLFKGVPVGALSAGRP